MTESVLISETAKKVSRSLPSRRRAQVRHRLYGILAIALGTCTLLALIISVIGRGLPAFQHTVFSLDVDTSPQAFGVEPGSDILKDGNFQLPIRIALRTLIPEAKKRSDKRELYKLASTGAGYALRELLEINPSVMGSKVRLVFPASDDVQAFLTGTVTRNSSGGAGKLSAKQVKWVENLVESGVLKRVFNSSFFTNADSREPELAGILGAVVGSALSLVICLLISFPLGVLAAIHLEEFAKPSKMTDFIEVNINNLAAVPSIVFGLLGLAVFLNWAGMPRSAPVVGGLVLSLMTLPTIIIAGRAALKSVPVSIRDAALALGASPLQACFHHVVPLAMPGMLTGSILGMARALGETAPLLMIGMVAFIADVPAGVTDPATALPVQVYLWADSPERAFAEKTAAAILVLLVFLFLMNLTAIVLRKKFEVRY
jgi:phosphate transport system permease protein